MNKPKHTNRTFFEVKIRFEESDGEKVKHTIETQAVDAETFIEAPARAMEYNSALDGLEIKGVKLANFRTVVWYPGDTEHELNFYRCKVSDVLTLDNGKTKKCKHNYLVQAPTLGLARDVVVAFMSDSPDKYVIDSLVDCKIKEILLKDGE